MAKFIKNVQSGKSLAVSDGNPNEGTLILQWDFIGNGSQQWQLEPQPSGATKIRNLGSNMVIAVPDGTQQANAQLIQWPDNGGNEQLWMMEPVEPVSGGGVSFQNVATQQFMNVSEGSSDNGAAVIQSPAFLNQLAPNGIWNVSD